MLIFTDQPFLNLYSKIAFELFNLIHKNINLHLNLRPFETKNHPKGHCERIRSVYFYRVQGTKEQ